MVITSGLAKSIELDTVYGVRDLYDLAEIVMVNAHNEAVMNRKDS